MSTSTTRAPVPAGEPDDSGARRRALAAQLSRRAARPGPLTSAQLRLFTLWQLNPRSSAYHESVVLRLAGELDGEVLLSCLRALPERHEWLRSRIEPREDDAVQVLDDQLLPDVRFSDLSDLSLLSDRISHDGASDDGPLPNVLRDWVTALTDEVFALESGAVWRAGLARLTPNDHVLVLVVHHVACDAAAFGVLLDELEERYTAARTARPLVLAAAVSPRDVAARVRQQQTGQPARAAVDRCADELAGADVTARLPPLHRTDADADAAPGPARVVSRRLPIAVAARVKQLATELAVSPFAILTTAIVAATGRTIGTDDLVVAIPVDLRWQRPEDEHVVAFLIETLPVRLRGLPRRSLRSLAVDVRDATIAALDQPPPFLAVVEELRRRGELAARDTPVHVYVNALDGSESTRLGADGPRVHHIDEPSGPAKVDLSWTVVSTGPDLVLRLEFDTARSTVESAQRLLDRALHVLKVSTGAPDMPMGELGLLTAEDEAQLARWEGRPGPGPETDLITVTTRGLAGSATPAVMTPGHEPVDGPELLRRADLVAAALLAVGVRPHDRVAVSGRRGPSMVVALLAVLRVGAAFVPVDERYPAGRQQDLAVRAEVRAVLGPSDWAAGLARQLALPTVPLDAEGLPSGDRSSPPPAWPVRQPGDTAYVLFTSGSTGTPKGVQVSDAAVVARITSYGQVLTEDPVCYLLQSALVFDASIYLFWVLAGGGCLVLPRDEQAADPGRLVELVRRHKVTDGFFVPALYTALLDTARIGELSSLRRVCVGGEVFPPPLAGRHAALLPGTTLLNVYGPTEVVVTSTAHAVHAGSAEPDGIPIGSPHPGTAARVLDGSGVRVAPGAPGELHLGGPSVALGYAGERSDAAPFSTVPDHDGRPVRWYATGDVVRWRNDGQLVFVGRKDRQVKVRGQRIELAEVEAALLAAPGVRAASVEVVGTAGAARLVAVVAPTTDGVRDAVAAVLPAAWVPELLVSVPSLPRTAGGKVDRGAVRRLAEAENPRGPVSRAGVGQPSSTVEKMVLSLVRDLLGRPDLHLDSDFFAEGGNSLLAARLIGALAAQLDATVPLHQLAVGPTSRQIAAALGTEMAGRHLARAHAEVVPLRPQGTKMPLVVVAREGDASLFLRQVLTDLDTDRPLWMVLRPMPAPGVGVPDLVASGRMVAAALRAHFPHGPVHLVGHSASGLVALETARALADRRGITILLDTTCPGTRSRPPWRWVHGPVVKARHHLALLRHRLHPWQQRWRGGPASDAIEILRYRQEELASTLARVDRADFPVSLVAVADSRAEAGRPDLGWARLCPALTVLEVPGEHLGMLLRPDVTWTARAVGLALASAE